MSPRILHRLTGLLVAMVSCVQFLLTVQITVPYWDPGELSAAAYLLQVPHPPGGPLFSLMGRIFYLLPIPGDMGLKVNLVSAIASVAAVFFLYLIAVKLIEQMRGARVATVAEAIETYGAAAIGALALSFADSFWFNGVESNYFAASTLLFSMMVWLMLKWNEQADVPGSDRYLLAIAYLAGLSAGVHLMSVPAIFAAIMLVVFRRITRNDTACKQSAWVFVAHVAVILVVIYGMWSNLTNAEPPSIEDAKAYDTRFVAIMGAISVVVLGAFWKKVFTKDSFYLALAAGAMALGLAYPGVIKKLPQLVHVLAADNSTTGGVILLAIVAALGGIALWARRNKKALLHLVALGVLLVILGFSTYTMILIRANKHTPMNENEPKTFSALLTYLNREQYGDFPMFKRRWTMEPERQRTFTAYTSDFDFFWRYQMNHMFIRYMLFNYGGRASRDQDADWSPNQLFAIPLLMGLFGVYTHFRKNWRVASVFLMLFVIMGFLIAFYQNQQDPQPRERDYFYGGAYFVFALWIALGVYGIVGRVRERLASATWVHAASAAILLLALFFIPVRMAWTNWHTHDRSRNWTAWETAYNMLQTCDRDGILITAGDNDTFPLWFLQDVEGIRRDVRVVNLSLANTNWYVQQLKEKPYYEEAKAVPLSMSDRIIAAAQAVAWNPQVVSLPVPPEAFATEGITDTTVIHKGSMEWRMPNTLDYGPTKAIRFQDAVVLDIIRTNRWKRPIYFAITCPPDCRIGLDEYLRICGLGYRLTPTKSSARDLGVDEPALAAQVMADPQEISAGPQRGFKQGTVPDTTVYLDENEIRPLYGLRIAFRALGSYYMGVTRDPQKAAAVAERMLQVIPPPRFAPTLDENGELASVFLQAGQPEKAALYGGRAEAQFAAMTPSMLASNPSAFRVMLDLYAIEHRYAKALELLQNLQRMYPGDPSIASRIQQVQQMMQSGQIQP
jgi:hypothetical protein